MFRRMFSIEPTTDHPGGGVVAPPAVSPHPPPQGYYPTTTDRRYSAELVYSEPAARRTADHPQVITGAKTARIFGTTRRAPKPPPPPVTDHLSPKTAGRCPERAKLAVLRVG